MYHFVFKIIYLQYSDRSVLQSYKTVSNIVALCSVIFDLSKADEMKSVSKLSYGNKQSVSFFLLQADITLMANKGDPMVAGLDMTGIKVEDRKLMGEQNCMLVIASNVLLHTELLQTAVSALADGACILSRENPHTDSVGNNHFGLEIVFEKTLHDEKLVLLRKVCVYVCMYICIYL
jgi:hypothetical protein